MRSFRSVVAGCLILHGYLASELYQSPPSDPSIFTFDNWRVLTHTEQPTYTDGDAPVPPVSESWKDPTAEIFVGIVSYRDRRCSQTLANLFDKAEFPDRVRVGKFNRLISCLGRPCLIPSFCMSRCGGTSTDRRRLFLLPRGLLQVKALHHRPQLPPPRPDQHHPADPQPRPRAKLRALHARKPAPKRGVLHADRRAQRLCPALGHFADADVGQCAERVRGIVVHPGGHRGAAAPIVKPRRPSRTTLVPCQSRRQVTILLYLLATYVHVYARCIMQCIMNFCEEDYRVLL